MLNRLIVNWVYGGFLAGVLLLALTPILARSWPASLVCTFLCLPVYMLHQYEEHDNDRFRRFVNEAMGKGREVLSPAAVFVINVPGVWGVIAISLALAATLNIGLGLIALYLVVVNGIIHVAHAIIFRRYNPGLGTAIGLFLPLGAYGIMAICRAGGGIAAMHAVGLVVAIGIHVAIIIHVFRQ